MTHLTYSGLCCFFFCSTERIDERNINSIVGFTPTTRDHTYIYIAFCVVAFISYVEVVIFQVIPDSSVPSDCSLAKLI